MTSTSSQNKKRFNALLAQSFKKQWIYFTIVACLTVFSMIIMAVYQFDNSIYYSYDIADNMTMSLMLAIAMCILFSFFTAPRLFKETFKKQQCDIYFSLPVKRGEYFCANYISGLISNVLICLICVLSIVIQSLCYQNRTLENTKSLVIFSIAMFLSAILTYSVFVLCATVSGKRVHYVLVSLLLLVSSTYAVNGVVSKIDTIWGVSAIDLLGVLIINPFSTLIDYYSNISILVLILPIIFIVLIFALALFCFKQRKAEVAQTSLSGRIVPLLLLAVFIASAFFYGDSWGKKYVGVVIGFVLCWICGLVYSAIFFKRPYTKQSAIVTVCMAVICAIISIIPIMPSQLRWFEKIVPEPSNVESVTLQYDSDDYMSEWSSSSYEEIKFTSPDAIEKIIAYNNAICEDGVIDNAKIESNISLIKTMVFDDYLNSYDYFDSTYNDITLTYKLKNGRTVKKYYPVSNYVKSEELAAALTTQDVFDSSEFLNIKQDDIVDLSISEFKLTKAGEVDEWGYELEEDEYMPHVTKKTISDFSELSKPYQKDIAEYISKTKVDAMIDLTDAGYVDNYDWTYSRFTGDSDYYYSEYNTDKYMIDVYYYDKNITTKDKKAIESLDKASRESLMSFAGDSYEYNEYRSSSVFDIIQLSKSVKHKVFVISSFDKNLCAYMDSLPEVK